MIAFAPPALAQAPVGTLQCSVGSSVGHITSSLKPLSCLFHPIQGGPPEQYTGSLGNVGVNLGITNGGALNWAVAMATPSPGPYALAGTYTGASAGITILGGAEANALVSTGANSVSLQPLSGSTQSGLNLTAGVGTLTLAAVLPPEAAPPPPRRHHKHHHHH